MFHPFLIPHCFLGYSKASSKAAAMRHILGLDHSSRKCIRKMLTYVDFKVGFI
jgi:hypothetical protein